MAELVIAWLRLVVVISLVFLGVYGAEQSNAVDGWIVDGNVPEGQTIENDAIIAGTQVSIDGDVEGDVMLLAIDAEINGNITGSVVVTARSLTVNGKVSGSLYYVGRELKLLEGSEVARNVYFLGLRTETAPDSLVGRDLVGASLTARLGGTVGRDLKAMIGLFELLGEFAAGENEDGVTPEPVPEGDATGPWGRISSMLRKTPLATLGSAVYRPFWPFVMENSIDAQKSMQKPLDVQEWAKDTLEEFLSLLLVGWVFIKWVNPTIQKWSDKVREKPWISSGYGLIAMVAAINIGIIIGIAFILILVIFFILGFMSLWDLAWLFGALTIFALGLFATLFFLFVIYGGKAIAAYAVTRLIGRRISENLVKHQYLVMFTGVLVFVLLASIPYVGWVVEAIASVIGLGAVWLVYIDQRQQKKATSQDSNDLREAVVDA